MLAFKWGGESLLDRYYSTWRWVPNNLETVPRSLIFGHCGHDKGGEYLSCGWFNYQWSWCYSLNGRECWADELQTRFGFHTSGYWSNLQCQFKSNHNFGNMTLCWLRLKLLEPSIVRELQPEHSLSRGANLSQKKRPYKKASRILTSKQQVNAYVDIKQ
jgi:hypothetical protein